MLGLAFSFYIIELSVFMCPVMSFGACVCHGISDYVLSILLNSIVIVLVMLIAFCEGYFAKLFAMVSNE